MRTHWRDSEMLELRRAVTAWRWHVKVMARLGAFDRTSQQFKSTWLHAITWDKKDELDKLYNSVIMCECDEEMRRMLISTTRLYYPKVHPDAICRTTYQLLKSEDIRAQLVRRHSKRGGR